MSRIVRSAGGVVVVLWGEDLLGLFVSHSPNVDLQIPKGMLEADEPVEVAALREVEEESGCGASLLALVGVGEWDYEYEGSMFHEVCSFFLMNTSKMDLGPHDDEFECVQWVPLSDAAPRMRYALESRIVEDVSRRLSECREVKVAEGRGLWGRSALGAAFWATDTLPVQGSAADRGLILFRHELHPRDAGYLRSAAGVVATIGGPASHLAVVAAGMRIPSISGVRLSFAGDLCWLQDRALLRVGCRLRIDAGEGTVWAQFDGPVHELEAATPSAGGDMDVHEYVARTCRILGINVTNNYKFFKRDLAARFFPTPSATRFAAGWSVEAILDCWRSLGCVQVRVSILPEDIACHATSLLLSSEEAEARAQLQSLSSESPCEVFTQQSPDQLAFRCVMVGDRVQIEGGLGQAMYIFETERGRWATSQCELTRLGEPVGRVTGDDGATSAALERLIQLRGTDLVGRMAEAAGQIQASHFAVEGYFRPNTGEWTVVDVDLPEDRFLMANE